MTDKMTFGYLCEEALLTEYEGLIASEKSGRCTREHYKKLGHILGFRVYGKIPTARRIAAAILAAILICVGGCMAFRGHEDQEKIFLRSGDTALCGDHLYYRNDGNHGQEPGLRYQLLTSIGEKGFAMDGSVNQDQFESPFRVYMGVEFIADPLATEENDDFPIIYVGGTFFLYQPTLNTTEMIYTYNAKNMKIDPTAKMPSCLIQDFFLYGDTLIVNCDESDLGSNIYLMNTDGSFFRMVENPEKEVLRVVMAHENVLYYASGDKIYSIPLDLSGEAVFCFEDTVDNRTTFVHDGYLYYMTWKTSQLVRRPFSDLSTVEIMTEYPIWGRACASGELIYYRYQNDDKKNGYDNHKTYVFHPETGESELIFENTDPERYLTFTGMTEDYVVFEWQNTSWERICLFVLDRKTGKTMTVPY